jgi:phage antirepressor YoqD-like protein
MLTITTTGATMTSREIADLVESRHDKVKQSIERLAERGVFQLPPLGEVKNHLGQAVTEYLVGKRESYIVVAQLSPEFTARLVDRWQELEAGAAPALPQSFAAALRLAADQQDTIAAQAEQLAAAAPAVEFVEKFVDASGLKGFREVAKLLKVKENEFSEFLVEREIMYRLAGRLTPYAPHLDAGRFKVTAGVTKEDRAFSTAKFTAKGIEWVAGELARWQLAQRSEKEVCHGACP